MTELCELDERYKGIRSQSLFPRLEIGAGLKCVPHLNYLEKWNMPLQVKQVLAITIIAVIIAAASLGEVYLLTQQVNQQSVKVNELSSQLAKATGDLAASQQTVKMYSTAALTIVVEGHEGGSLGPDGKTHDTVMPSNFTVQLGQTVELTFINYDEGPHTFTSLDLGVNSQYPGALGVGKPSVTHFQFVASKAGVFRWYCTLPCDMGQGGWAMTTGTDGQPGQLGFMGGYVTVVG